MPRVGGLEVDVAVQVIGEETHACLERHQLGADGQGADFGFGQRAAGAAEKARGIGFKQREAEMHLCEVGFVLGRRGSARTDGIAEVEGREAGHHGVEIDDADGPAGAVVDQHIAHLCVVVRDLERQRALREQVRQHCAVGLARPRERELRGDRLHPAGLIERGGLHELAKARGRVVKMRDRLVQRFGRVIREHALESAEGRAGFREHFRRGGALKGRGALNVQRCAPVMPAAVDIPVGAVRRFEHGQRAAGGVAALRLELARDEARDAEHILHELVRARKNKLVDALEDVFAARAQDKVGVVDVSVAVRGDGQNFAAEIISRGGLAV